MNWIKTLFRNPSLVIKEVFARLAIAIIRDMVTTSLKRMGYERGDDATWTLVREDLTAIGGPKIGASVSEANCIREFVNQALLTLYKEKFNEQSIRRHQTA